MGIRVSETETEQARCEIIDLIGIGGLDKIGPVASLKLTTAWASMLAESNDVGAFAPVDMRICRKCGRRAIQSGYVCRCCGADPTVRE